jgi:hypothetical protein
VRTIFVSAVAVVLSGCFASIDRAKAIEVERRWYGTVYAQRGDQLDYWGMMSALESEEVARPHVERSRRYFYGATTTAVAGGLSLGFGIGELNRSGGNPTVGWTLVGVGVAFLIPMEVLASAQRSAMEDAVAAHNSLIRGDAPAAAGVCELRGPWIAALPDGRGGTVRAAGLEGAF